MKNVLKLSAIFCLIFLLMSCEKDREITPVQLANQTENSFKIEDETISYVNVPTILGSFSTSQQKREEGVIANLVGINNNYDETTILNLSGIYSFTNVPVGTYERKIFIDGILENTITYIVLY